MTASPKAGIRKSAKGILPALPLPTERQGQRAVLAWLELALPKPHFVAHIANESAVNPNLPPHAKARYFEERRKDGVREGVPDLIICLPGRRALFVEMKRIKGGRVSEAQEGCIAELQALGFPVTVARTIEDVRALLVADGVRLHDVVMPEVRAA